jgi:hypothetical protein
MANIVSLFSVNNYKVYLLAALALYSHAGFTTSLDLNGIAYFVGKKNAYTMMQSNSSMLTKNSGTWQQFTTYAH